MSVILSADGQISAFGTPTAFMPLPILLTLGCAAKPCDLKPSLRGKTNKQMTDERITI
jgi:hypothetical protein